MTKKKHVGSLKYVGGGGGIGGGEVYTKIVSFYLAHFGIEH